MLSKEELLVPRFKVIADFPYNPFNIGQILTPFFVEDSPNIKKWYVQNDYDYSWINVEEYPAIFKPLEWWEDRSFEELPEYLKFSSGEVYKVLKYTKDHFTIDPKQHATSNRWPINWLSVISPSTRDEYEKTN